MTTGEKKDAATIRLPAKLNSASAEDVLEMVNAQKGRSVFVDAADVKMIGAQCLQVLIAAHKAWSADSLEFEVRNLTDEMRGSLGILGLTAEQIGARELTYGA